VEQQRLVIGATGGDDDMVDRRRQLVEELLEPDGVVGVEGRGAQGLQLARGLLQALLVAGSEDDPGAFGPGAPRGLEADARAAADDDDSLAEQLRMTLGADVGARP
jgi:hypothetical protein